MFFDLGREEKFPTQYGPARTPVTVDVLEVGLILAFVILAISFYVSLLSSRVSESVNLYVRITMSLLIGSFILLGNFGQEWEVAHIHSKTAYKAGISTEIYADIGVKIGLRSVNITLKSQHNSEILKKEVINYNERFEWTWQQGRFGFGPYSGHIQQEFRAAQYRGVPTPILWIADYFVIDGEGQRFGRFYRTAGWYAHIAIWSAFPCWVFANIFSRTVLRYCGYSLGLTGFFQLLGNFLWITVRNPNPLEIPFEDGVIRTKYGSSFWLTFSSGVICLMLCIIIIIAERKWHFQLHTFFGLSPLMNSDEKYLTYDEVEQFQKQAQNDDHRSDDQEMLVHLRSNPGTSRDSRRESVIVHVRKNTNTLLKPARPALPPKQRPVPPLPAKTRFK